MFGENAIFYKSHKPMRLMLVNDQIKKDISLIELVMQSTRTYNSGVSTSKCL